MRIQLLSDLHLEANPAFVPKPDPEADLLVLAGDIGSYQTLADGRCMDEPDWGLRRFSPRPEFAAWPVPVVFVPGNHEYDGLDWERAHTELRTTCERLGIQWLEREVLTLGSVRLIGTTLWTDFDAVGPRDKAFRAANFYLSKMGATRHGQPFDAQAMRALGLDCQDWLRRALHTPFDGTTVVITHFAPTLHSADPRYGRTPGTAGFCNAMDDCLPLADVWMHGHLHCPQDQQLGRCHLIANPLGYAHKNEQAAFVPQSSWRVTPA